MKIDTIRDKTIVLNLLSQLAQSEETVVREQAIRSLQAISHLLISSEMQHVFTPLVLNLTHSDRFLGGQSAASLIPHAYPKAGYAHQELLWKKFLELSCCETPLIRRRCAAKIGDFAQVLD